MKKTTYTIIYALAATLALAGCTKELQIAEPVPSEGTIVSFRVQGETRAALDGMKIKFQPGDRISVFDGAGNNCEFTQTGKIASDGSATFTGKVSEVASSYLALYPYMADVRTANGKIGTVGTDEVRRPVVLPVEQKAVSGSFDPASFFSVASSERIDNSRHSISFNAACALVKFTLPDDLQGFTFEKAVLKSGAKMLAGAMTIAPDGTESYVGPGCDSLILSGTMKEGESFYFCALPHDIKGISLSLYHYSTDKEPLVVKTAASGNVASLVRNRVLDLGTIEVVDLPSKEAGWYGDGTAANPYQISCVEDMELLLGRLADQDDPSYRGLCYRMTDDIDCGGIALIEDDRTVEFCGTFDGNGHTLSNYLPSAVSWYDQGWKQLWGLFHKAYRATFKNLTLEPAQTIYTDFNGLSYSSFLVAQMVETGSPTLIQNCHLKGSISLSASLTDNGTLDFGGFVGFNYADILTFSNCSNSIELTFSEYRHEMHDEDWHYWELCLGENTNYHIGGFVGNMYCKGRNATTTFDRCRNRGTLTFTHSMTGGDIHCGGFIGFSEWAFLYASTFSFTNCVNSGDITLSVGSENNSAYASGFFGFDQIDGDNHCTSSAAPEQHMAKPRFYNCLNKGDLSVTGNSAHAAGFAYYCKHGGTDNSNQFAICVNIGKISAIGSSTYKAAISNGYGTCRWCWWQEDDKTNPVLSCTLSGVAYNCYCYPTINADTPNNRRVGSDGHGGVDIVLDQTNTQWTNAQWKANTVEWTGGSRDRSLDLDF